MGGPVRGARLARNRCKWCGAVVRTLSTWIWLRGSRHYDRSCPNCGLLDADERESRPGATLEAIRDREASRGPASDVRLQQSTLGPAWTAPRW